MHFLEPQEIAKLIEGHTAIKEYSAHHVPLAAIKTIGGVVVVLPYGAQTGLYLLGVLKLPHLLKLIDAYYDAAVLALGDVFSHIEHFLWRMRLRGYPKRHADFRDRIDRYPYSWRQAYQEVAGLLHPELHLGGCLFQDRNCKGIIEVVLRLTSEDVEPYDDDVLSFQVSAYVVNE